MNEDTEKQAMNYTIHTYQGTRDLADMLALVRARPAELALKFPGLVDLHELMGDQTHRELTRLWRTPEGRLAGFALLLTGATYASFAIECSEDEMENELGNAMITWGETAYLSSYHGQANDLGCSVEENDPVKIALLERNGFTRCDADVLRLDRSLCEAIPRPEPPAGFTLRPLLGDQEIPAWVMLHRAAFGTENMTEESRLSFARAPEYDPDLDLVAAAPDGRLAAYVFGSISREENELTGQKIGNADPVGTHPDFQRIGLCRALLLECLHRLKERGMETARLGTGSWNIAMRQAAESAGFRVSGLTRLYRKDMSQQADAEEEQT